MMWMNLDTLPPEIHQYVAFIGDGAQDWSQPDSIMFEEVDFQAGPHDDTDELVVLAKLEIAKLYDVELEILGIADQSSGEWMYLSNHGKLLKR